MLWRNVVNNKSSEEKKKEMSQSVINSNLKDDAHCAAARGSKSKTRFVFVADHLQIDDFRAQFRSLLGVFIKR